MTEISHVDLICIARAAHEVHRQFSIMRCEPEDDQKDEWTYSNDMDKFIAVNSVLGIIKGNDAEKSHAQWVQDMKAMGYVLGTMKNDGKDGKPKTHPGMVPFSELPFDVQQKDKLWVNTVKAMLSALSTIPQQ
jgi:hypothetical protein